MESMRRILAIVLGVSLIPLSHAAGPEPSGPQVDQAEETTDPPAETPGLLPPLGEVPEPVLTDDPWSLVDEPMVDLALLERRQWEPPAASVLLPPRAVLAPAKHYHILKFEGNHVIRSNELSSLIPWATERLIGPEELAEMEDVITRHYISKGYVNSGAEAAEAADDEGVLLVRITEGRLTKVVLDRKTGDNQLPFPGDDCFTCLFNGRRHLRDSYLRSRVMGNQRLPLNFLDLQQRLQVMQMNPNVKRLQAELKPGLLPGEAVVELAVEETPAWSYGAEINNGLPPSVGAEQLELWLASTNLTGYSDALTLRYGAFSGGLERTDSAGLDNLQFRYSRPVWWDDTSLEFFFDSQGYAIIEEPFTELGITGSSWSAGVGIRRPVLRDLRDNVWWGASLERNHSETELLGEPFSVSPGYVDGILNLSLLRCGIDWVRRGEREVITANADVVFGLEGLGATESTAEPDSSFIAIRAGATYLKRVNALGHLLTLRVAGQWADSPLPSPQQWTLGGYPTVRGYRENELVRDAGVLAGVEYRIPVLSGATGELNFVSFLDGGVGIDNDGGNTEGLCSIGIGLTGNYHGWLNGELFWGLPLVNDHNSGSNLQDYGIYFRLGAGKF
jgi:hemolysin activation/secretion protein